MNLPVHLRCQWYSGILSQLTQRPTSIRHFTATPPLAKKALPSRPKLPPDEEIEESYLKGSGPGGQKINKTNSAVQLKHIPTGIVVKCQAQRSQAQNRREARRILATKIDDLLNGDKSRSSIVGEVKRKKAASAAKKSRRKYRALEEAKVKAEERGLGDETSEESYEVEEKEREPSLETEPEEETSTEPRIPQHGGSQAHTPHVH